MQGYAARRKKIVELMAGGHSYEDALRVSIEFVEEVPDVAKGSLEVGCLATVDGDLYGKSPSHITG